jgi:hypothetical protein
MHSKLDSKQPLATRNFLLSGRLQPPIAASHVPNDCHRFGTARTGPLTGVIIDCFIYPNLRGRALYEHA